MDGHGHGNGRSRWNGPERSGTKWNGQERNETKRNEVEQTVTFSAKNERFTVITTEHLDAQFLKMKVSLVNLKK